MVLVDGKRETIRPSDEAASVWHVIEAWRWASRGVLPVAGGLLDQCAAFVRCCEVIDAEMNRGDE